MRSMIVWEARCSRRGRCCDCERSGISSEALCKYWLCGWDVRRLSRNEAKLSLEGAEGNREDEKKFEVAGSPKFIGEGESVAGCDISVNDLCGRVIRLVSFQKVKVVGGSTLWRWGSGDHISITFTSRIRGLSVVLRRHQRNACIIAGGSARCAAAMGGERIYCRVDVGEEVLRSV